MLGGEEMTENEVIEKLSGLRYKIRHDSFCNKVYSSELEALVECPVCGADVNCRNKYCHRCGQKLEVQS